MTKKSGTSIIITASVKILTNNTCHTLPDKNLIDTNDNVITRLEGSFFRTRRA